MTPNGYRVSVGGDEVSNRPVIAAQLGIGLKPSDCPSGVGKLPFEFVSTKLFEKTVLCSKRTRLHIMKKTNHQGLAVIFAEISVSTIIRHWESQHPATGLTL